MALGFFDGASTPEQLARRRAELDFLASGMGRAQNVGQGVGDIFRGIGVGLGRYRANKQENAGIEGANKAWSAFNPFGSPQTPPQAPQVSGGAAFPNPATMTAQNPVQGPARVSGGFGGIPETRQEPVAPRVAAAPMPGSGFAGTGVAGAGAGWTDIVGPDGKVIHREGSRNWRNNNPGNIEFGDFAKNNGAIGTDGRFAVFPSYEAGRKAKESLLFNSPGYRDKTLAQAISRYAPSFENDTGGYISQIAQAAGVNPNTPLSQLSPEQRVAMMDAMQRVEGFKVGRESMNGQPVQVASNDPQGAFAMPASAPPNDMAQAQPIPQPIQQQPQQVAQAQPPVQQQGGADNARLKQLWELSQNQFLNPAQQSMAKMLFEQEMQKQDPAYQMKMQGDQIGLDTAKLQLDAMKNPKPKVEHVGNSLVQINPDSSVKQIYTDNAGNKIDTQITDVAGRRLLVNAQNGETIKDLGESPTKQANAPAGYRQTENGNLERIPGYRDSNLEMDMRKEFDAQTKDFRAVRDSYNRIQASAENPTPAGDLALIFNYMKMLDPGSVVRESEFATASNAAPLLTRYGLDPEKLKGVWAGQRLTPEQRADFLNRSEQLYSEQDQTFQTLADQYSETAARNGLDPKNIILTPRQNPRKKAVGNDGWKDMGGGIKIRKKQ